MSGLLLLRRALPQRCLSSRPLQPAQARRYALIGKPKANSSGPTWALPGTPARTRFAPSPTGYLHLGSLRTALFNYLLAQATGGQFIIRLEDTDQARFVRDSEDRLYDDLRWAGLHWDEGPDKEGKFGPYKQSLRLELYRQHAKQLLDNGQAFRCFCSREDLEFNVQQATAGGHAAHYPGTCTGISISESDRRAASGEPHTIRFKASETPVTAPDLVYGAYKKAEREDDFIIIKSDGFPTYHFANVVDDHYMDITHVIRGAEWLISTPKHVELYNAFGWKPPNFAHVGLLVDQQRQKLSKRDIDNIGVSIYRQQNILPEALLNYAVLLGWDPNLQNNPKLDKRGFMSQQEMKDNFTLKFTRGDIVVDLAKLKHFQARLTRNLISGTAEDPEALHKHIVGPVLSTLEKIHESLESGKLLDELSPEEDKLLRDVIGKREASEPKKTEDYVLRVLRAWKGPLNDLSQWTYNNIFAFYPISAAALRTSLTTLQENMRRIQITKGEKAVLNADIHKVLAWFWRRLDDIPEDKWNEENLGPVAKELAESIQYYDAAKEQLMDHGAGWKFLRWALLNGNAGLSVVPVMALLGREETRRRIRLARKTARHEEDKQQLLREDEVRRAEINRVRVKYLGQTFREEAKRQDAERELLSRTIEPRNVEVRLRKPSLPETPETPFGAGLPPKRPVEGPPPGAKPLSVPRAEHKPRFSDPAPKPEVKRDPKDVERSPQFLDFHTWVTAQRHLDLDGKLARDEKNDATAATETEFEAKTEDEHPGSSPQTSNGDVADEATTNWASPSYKRGSGGASLVAPKKSNKSAAPKQGPFKLGTGYENYQEHVRHLQALNAAARQRREARENNSHSNDLKTSKPGPMLIEKTASVPGTAGSSVSRGKWDYLESLKRKGALRLSPEVTRQELMESKASKARAAELERTVRREVAEEERHRESLNVAERKLGMHWTSRFR